MEEFGRVLGYGYIGFARIFDSMHSERGLIFMRKKMGNVMFIAMIGVMGAVCFAANFLYVPLPPIAGTTPRIHLGNIMCLLSGLILGPIPGGIAAGVGSMFFDLTNPLYIASAPFTLIFKFLMAFVCGKIAWGKNTEAKLFKRNIFAAAMGQLAYLVLYLGKDLITNLYFNRLEIETALLSLLQKGVTSGINAIIAVVFAVPLAFALRKGLDQANLQGLRNMR